LERILVVIQTIFPKDCYQRCQVEVASYLVDVRTLEEYQELRAKGVIHIPLDQVSGSKLNEAGIKLTDEVYVICRSGARSLKACEILAEDGFRNLFNVAGGTIAWLEAGLPHELG